MIEISFKADVADLTKNFTMYERKQVPYALSLTMARLGNQSRDALVKAMGEVFEGPTPFTLKAVRVAWVSKDPDGMRYRVSLNEWAPKGTAPVKYLYPEVEGGIRNETRFERALRFAGKLPDGMSVVPGQGTPLDANGNVRNGFHSSVLSMLRASTDPMQNTTKLVTKRKGKIHKASLFIGRPGGGQLPLGIYIGERLSVTPLFLFIPRRPTYKPRLPFYAILTKLYNLRFNAEFTKAFANAMRTAR